MWRGRTYSPNVPEERRMNESPPMRGFFIGGKRPTADASSLRPRAERLVSPVFRSAPHGLHVDFAGLRSHRRKLRVRRELGNGSREVLVEGIATFLLNLAALRRILIAVTAIESGFLHVNVLQGCFRIIGIVGLTERGCSHHSSIKQVAAS